MREHLAVIDALETRDSRKAADAISGHILRALDRALGLQGPVMSDLTSAKASFP